MVWRRSLLALVLGVGSVGFTAPEPELGLSWRAPADCPTEQQVRSAIEGHLGRSIGAAPSELLRADAHVTRESKKRFVLRLRTQTVSGVKERVVDADRCEVLADATALIVAIAIDPGVTERLAQQEDDETEAVEPAPAKPTPKPAPPPPEPASPEPEKQPRLMGAVRIHGAGLVGALPELAPGVGGAAALLLPRARVEAFGTFWFEREARVGANGDTGGDIRLWALGLRGCWVPTVRRLELPLCAGAEFGSMTGVGVGIAEPQTTRLPWVALDVGGALAFRVWRYLALWAGVDLLVPLSRPDFTIENLGRVHRAAPVAGQGFLGVEARFP